MKALNLVVNSLQSMDGNRSERAIDHLSIPTSRIWRSRPNHMDHGALCQSRRLCFVGFADPRNCALLFGDHCVRSSANGKGMTRLYLSTDRDMRIEGRRTGEEEGITSYQL